MIYTVDEIARLVLPIAKRYELKAVYLFGSYARGTATENSDVDLLQVAAIFCDLEAVLGKSVDLITVSSLQQKMQMPSESNFRKTVWDEKVNIYVAA